MPRDLQEYGQIWIDTQKYFVSRRRTEAAYNTELIGGPDAIERLRDIRTGTDGDIGVGGADLATQVLEAGLLDELLPFIHPALLGSGRPLFDRLDEPIGLELLEHAEFEDGVAMRRYGVVTLTSPCTGSVGVD